MLTSTPPPGFFCRRQEFFAPDRELGYVVTPGYYGSGTYGTELVKIFTDRTGARRTSQDAEVTETADIVVVGGEQAFGLGVNCEDTFAERLGVRLGWSVRNFAIPLQSGAAALVMMERAIRLRPKVIVYGFFAADIVRNICAHVDVVGPVSRGVPVVELDPPRIRLPDNASLDDEIVRQWVAEQESLQDRPPAALRLKWKLFSKIMALRRSLDRRAAQDPQHQDRIVAAARFVISRMDQVAAAAGATLVVAYIPFYLQPPVYAAPELLAEPIQSLPNTILIDVAGIFGEELARGQQLNIAPSAMLNNHGHRLIANAIATTLIQRGVATAKRPNLGNLRASLGQAMR